ncbi:helix-turn-helix domain-containing protein [Pseudarthrobacter oxydans]|uniref:PucR family transcriptional regulator n=1 Tax=Pseudarthrobacter oxydans TaxID=1671 RepID=UPI002AA76FF3|nr:helix-turn-helix domain-containing protein [Pseudarthrobacter oxydans]WPU09627.1 helix-turn-helix domain-containing protein [Pseudarthrobacter oxydans]
MPNTASADRTPASAGAAPRSVVSDLVSDCLADIDRIAHQYLLEVQKIEDYAASAVAVQDLEETAVASIELLLRLVGSLPIPDRLAGMSDALGHRRAQQGLPLESLLRAVRMDFRVLWTAMLEKVPPSSLPELTKDAVRVWEAVEFHTIRVHAGYLDELASMAQEKETQRAFLLSRLLNSDGKDPQVLGQAARALGVAPDSNFIVAVAAEYAQKAFRAEVLRAGAEQFLHERDGALILILEDVPARTGREPEGARPWLSRVDCFVAPPARSLADVPRMLRIALESLPVVTPQRPGQRTVREAWGHVAMTRLGEYGTVLADTVLGPLATISTHERDRLIETVQAYLRTGSVSETAGELYCHRNTVLNRLARFGQLTSFDPANPQDAAAVIAALHVLFPAST